MYEILQFAVVETPTPKEGTAADVESFVSLTPPNVNAEAGFAAPVIVAAAGFVPNEKAGAAAGAVVAAGFAPKENAEAAAVGAVTAPLVEPNVGADVDEVVPEVAKPACVFAAPNEKVGADVLLLPNAALV